MRRAYNLAHKTASSQPQPAAQQPANSRPQPASQPATQQRSALTTTRSTRPPAVGSSQQQPAVTQLATSSITAGSEQQHSSSTSAASQHQQQGIGRPQKGSQRANQRRVRTYIYPSINSSKQAASARHLSQAMSSAAATARDGSVQKRVSDQRARLLALDYHEPFTAESLALVERLFEDLVTTTESYEDLQQRVRVGIGEQKCHTQSGHFRRVKVSLGLKILVLV